MLLPQKKVNASRKNPKKLIIFSKPKSGKTTTLAELDSNLIVDLEGGSDFVDALKINVPQIATEKGVHPLEVVKEIIKDLNEVKSKINKNPYQRITLDTVTVLEEMVLPLAADLYRQTPMGSSWAGNDVRKLPNGAGYAYTRDAFFFVLNQFERVCDTLILVGHVKRKSISVGDGEIDEKSLELTGKVPTMVCADADAIAYLYRDENKTILDFEPSESVIAGARSEHLRGKKITIAESDENGKIIVNWDNVFIKE